MSFARWSPVAIAFLALRAAPAPACMPVSALRTPVVNADQTVIILWDAPTKTQHFIRKASFKTEAADLGFVVPTPTQPELAEAGDEAFPVLEKLTEPEVIKRKRFPGFGCAAVVERDAGLSLSAAGNIPPVRVLEEKQVAGFNAVVLEADNADALTGWLKKHGYTYSPEVAVWAKPYVEAGWKFTAMKVAKDEREKKSVSAAALRMSFRTDRPLFPYREPDPAKASAALGVKERTLRIYFLAEAKYQGELTRQSPWTGKVVWSGKVSAANRTRLLELLKLPASTGPAGWWLTEFEDKWPYRAAPADLYFSRSRDQQAVKREPIIEYVKARYPTDVTIYALAVALVLLPLARLVRGAVARQRGLIT